MATPEDISSRLSPNSWFHQMLVMSATATQEIVKHATTLKSEYIEDTTEYSIALSSQKCEAPQQVHDVWLPSEVEVDFSSNEVGEENYSKDFWTDESENSSTTNTSNCYEYGYKTDESDNNAVRRPRHHPIDPPAKQLIPPTIAQPNSEDDNDDSWGDSVSKLRIELPQNCDVDDIIGDFTDSLASLETLETQKALLESQQKEQRLKQITSTSLRTSSFSQRTPPSAISITSPRFNRSIRTSSSRSTVNRRVFRFSTDDDEDKSQDTYSSEDQRYVLQYDSTIALQSSSSNGSTLSTLSITDALQLSPPRKKSSTASTTAATATPEDRRTNDEHDDPNNVREHDDKFFHNSWNYKPHNYHDTAGDESDRTTSNYRNVTDPPECVDEEDEKSCGKESAKSCESEVIEFLPPSWDEGCAVLLSQNDDENDNLHRKDNHEYPLQQESRDEIDDGYEQDDAEYKTNHNRVVRNIEDDRFAADADNNANSFSDVERKRVDDRYDDNKNSNNRLELDSEHSYNCKKIDSANSKKIDDLSEISSYDTTKIREDNKTLDSNNENRESSLKYGQSTFESDNFDHLSTIPEIEVTVSSHEEYISGSSMANHSGRGQVGHSSSTSELDSSDGEEDKLIVACDSDDDEDDDEDDSIQEKNSIRPDSVKNEELLRKPRYYVYVDRKHHDEVEITTISPGPLNRDSIFQTDLLNTKRSTNLQVRLSKLQSQLSSFQENLQKQKERLLAKKSPSSKERRNRLLQLEHEQETENPKHDDVLVKSRLPPLPAENFHRTSTGKTLHNESKLSEGLSLNSPGGMQQQRSRHDGDFIQAEASATISSSFSGSESYLLRPQQKHEEPYRPQTSDERLNIALTEGGKRNDVNNENDNNHQMSEPVQREESALHVKRDERPDQRSRIQDEQPQKLEEQRHTHICQKSADSSRQSPSGTPECDQKVEEEGTKQQEDPGSFKLQLQQKDDSPCKGELSDKGSNHKTMPLSPIAHLRLQDFEQRRQQQKHLRHPSKDSEQGVDAKPSLPKLPSPVGVSSSSSSSIFQLTYYNSRARATSPMVSPRLAASPKVMPNLLQQQPLTGKYYHSGATPTCPRPIVDLAEIQNQSPNRDRILPDIHQQQQLLQSELQIDRNDHVGRTSPRRLFEVEEAQKQLPYDFQILPVLPLQPKQNSADGNNHRGGTTVRPHPTDDLKPTEKQTPTEIQILPGLQQRPLHVVIDSDETQRETPITSHPKVDMEESPNEQNIVAIGKKLSEELCQRGPSDLQNIRDTILPARIGHMQEREGVTQHQDVDLGAVATASPSKYCIDEKLSGIISKCNNVDAKSVLLSQRKRASRLMKLHVTSPRNSPGNSKNLLAGFGNDSRGRGVKQSKAAIPIQVVSNNASLPRNEAVVSEETTIAMDSDLETLLNVNSASWDTIHTLTEEKVVPIAPSIDSNEKKPPRYGVRSISPATRVRSISQAERVRSISPAPRGSLTSPLVRSRSMSPLMRMRSTSPGALGLTASRRSSLVSDASRSQKRTDPNGCGKTSLYPNSKDVKTSPSRQEAPPIFTQSKTTTITKSIIPACEETGLRSSSNNETDNREQLTERNPSINCSNIAVPCISTPRKANSYIPRPSIRSNFRLSPGISRRSIQEGCLEGVDGISTPTLIISPKSSIISTPGISCAMLGTRTSSKTVASNCYAVAPENDKVIEPRSQRRMSLDEQIRTPVSRKGSVDRVDGQCTISSKVASPAIIPRDSASHAASATPLAAVAAATNYTPKGLVQKVNARRKRSKSGSFQLSENSKNRGTSLEKRNPPSIAQSKSNSDNESAASGSNARTRRRNGFVNARLTSQESAMSNNPHPICTDVCHSPSSHSGNFKVNSARGRSEIPAFDGKLKERSIHSAKHMMTTNIPSHGAHGMRKIVNASAASNAKTSLNHTGSLSPCTLSHQGEPHVGANSPLLSTEEEIRVVFERLNDAWNRDCDLRSFLDAYCDCDETRFATDGLSDDISTSARRSDFMNARRSSNASVFYGRKAVSAAFTRLFYQGRKGKNLKDIVRILFHRFPICTTVISDTDAIVFGRYVLELENCKKQCGVFTIHMRKGSAIPTDAKNDVMLESIVGENKRDCNGETTPRVNLSSSWNRSWRILSEHTTVTSSR